MIQSTYSSNQLADMTFSYYAHHVNMMRTSRFPSTANFSPSYSLVKERLTVRFDWVVYITFWGNIHRFHFPERQWASRAILLISSSPHLALVKFEPQTPRDATAWILAQAFFWEIISLVLGSLWVSINSHLIQLNLQMVAGLTFP